MRNSLNLSFCWENYDEEYSPELYDDPNWLDILENNLEEVQISREIAGETIHFKMGIRELVNSINPLIYQGDSVVTNKDERERNKNMESLIGNTLRDHDIDIDSIDYIFFILLINNRKYGNHNPRSLSRCGMHCGFRSVPLCGDRQVSENH